jgi:hypothetical protein
MKLEVIDLQALYPTFEAWWRARNVAPIPQAMLPRLGILVRQEGEPVAALWMYLDNSISLGFLNWFLTRPGLPAKQAKAALEHLLRFMAQEAQRLGITHLIASCTQASLSRLLCRNGYQFTGGGISHHHLSI